MFSASVCLLPLHHGLNSLNCGGRLASFFISAIAAFPIAAFPIAASAQTIPPISTTYNVITQKKIAGKQITKVGEGGAIDVEFSYRDNGRGPDIFEKMVVRPDGQIGRGSPKRTP